MLPPLQDALDRMLVLFPVPTARRQIFVIEFFCICRRFFFYHEALSAILMYSIKAFAVQRVLLGQPTAPAGDLSSY
jgi:hypothetical protein